MATVVSATALLALTVTSLGSAPRDWPPFLRAGDEYPAQIASAVKRLWTDATFTRTVSPDPVPVPLWFYLRFVDAPDLTAAAARHLRLTTYDVKVLGDDCTRPTTVTARTVSTAYSRATADDASSCRGAAEA